MSKLIDRDKLLDTFQYHCGQKNCEECKILTKEHCDTYMTIIEQPVVNKWISCKDKLPDKGAEVLLYSDGLIWVVSMTSNKSFETWGYKDGFIDDILVHGYWMPLPEPPHKGD